MPKKLTKKTAKALRTKMALHLAEAAQAALSAGVDAEGFESYAHEIFSGGGCPECAYEIVHGQAGTYYRYTCEDW
jgi:hypothetical protein